MVVLVAAAVGAVLYYGRSAPPAVPIQPIVNAPADAIIAIHVSGEVVAPGLVEVAYSGRVADAIAAAGGTTGTANLAGINLAAPIRDGEQIVVPSRLQSGVAETGAGDRVHLNTATASQLEAIPGVGPVLAARIISVRSELGSFQSVEDLLDVPGIGEAKLAAMRDMVAVP